MMHRRTVLQAGLTAAGSMSAATMARGAARESRKRDDRGVWLGGDDEERLPARTSARLASLAGQAGISRDAYLKGGAVEALEATFAALLGKQACVFMPTGTLANNVAMRVLCGDDHHAICQQDSHLYRDESDASQRLAGLNLVPIANGRLPDAEDVAAAITAAEQAAYPLRVGAISLESPIRLLHGDIIPQAAITRIAALASRRRIPMHLDAARLLLAPPSLDLHAYVAPFTTVYVSLYKYLGAPFGAVLAGDHATIAKAREFRHLYGGLLRDGWIPALLAMDGLSGFGATIARAHAAADALIQQLERNGRIRLRPNANASNIHMLEMPQSLAAAAFERGQAAGIHLARWQDGALPLYVNPTILRRREEEIAQLFA